MATTPAAAQSRGLSTLLAMEHGSLGWLADHGGGHQEALRTLGDGADRDMGIVPAA